MSGLICRNKGYRIGVLDRASVVHHNSYTIDREMPGYNDNAMRAMVNFFRQHSLLEEADKMRQYAAQYEFLSE